MKAVTCSGKVPHPDGLIWSLHFTRLVDHWETVQLSEYAIAEEARSDPKWLRMTRVSHTKSKHRASGAVVCHHVVQAIAMVRCS